LSHVNVTMPRGREDDARRFYAQLLGLAEIPKPEPLRARGGCWFEAGGLEIHVSVADDAPGSQRHFGLETADLGATRARLQAAGLAIDEGRPGPWRRFFVRDPFGNRIEIHEPGGTRGA
jgi:catechol 2,3-dioxygenase-like lactoylglutathione lyase family enzyme